MATRQITGIVRQQNRSTIVSQNFAPKPNVSISDVSGISVSGVENGQSLIYNSSSGKFEANTIVASVVAVNGGVF
jgi:hypothetical protein